VKHNDYEFGERINRRLQAEKAARRILGVTEDAGAEQLKKAYRRASLEHHPDHHPDDPDANKKFLLVKCAYELLAKDQPCDMLLQQISAWQGVPDDDKYRLDNRWGHFLWWREKFFE